MKCTISVLAMISVLVIGAGGTTARAPSAHRAEPALETQDLVAPELLTFGAER